MSAVVIEFIRKADQLGMTESPAVPDVGEEIELNSIIYKVVRRQWCLKRASNSPMQVALYLEGVYQRCRNRTTGEMVEIRRVEDGVVFREPTKDGERGIIGGNWAKTFVNQYDMLGVVE